SGLPEKGLRFRVIKNFLERRTGDKRLDQSILNLCAMVERSYLKRYLSFIGILASIAPLLGLLGTVTGMITTFNVISCSGTGNAKAMAEGISKALITTQGGLMVAVPGLYMGNFLNNHARRLENRLDELIMTIKRHMSDD
ncbi:MAG: MotA/TolQ/ExbB proton channel family protein, partial [Thermodesulfobacteriota bacterium]|nr:MotA/TolQ/ExbB proton channel family protein [Thermodesulfobacteriota bacterium]